MLGIILDVMLCDVMLAEKGYIFANPRVLFDSRCFSERLVQKLFDAVHPFHMTLWRGYYATHGTAAAAHGRNAGVLGTHEIHRIHRTPSSLKGVSQESEAAVHLVILHIGLRRLTTDGSVALVS